MDSYSVIQDLYEKYNQNPEDDTSLTQLIQACQGLVFHYAKLYGGGFCFEDLCQSGYEGLMKAVKSYNSERGVKFSTYASHSIIGEIRHYVRKESRYYYPDYLNNYKEKLDHTIQSTLENRDEPISLKELADTLNLKEDAILPLMSSGLVHLGHLEMDAIKAKEMESFTLPVEDKLFLSKLLYKLNGVQKDVIVMLYYREMTQEEVAQELKLTQKQVSRIKLKSLEKMNIYK